MLLLKALAVWLLIALTETLQGILRVKLLNRRIGDRRARQLSVITGSLFVLLIGWLTLPWIAPSTDRQSLTVGGLWLGLMLTFDFALGRLLMRASWSRLLEDFDLRRGGFLGFGMTVLFLTPLLIARCRQLY